MAETKYNLLTRLLKDLRNQVSSSGDIGGNSNVGGVMVVHEVTEVGEVLLTGTLPNLSGYSWRTEIKEGNTNTELYIIDVAVDLDDVDTDKMVVIIYDGDYPVRIDNTGDIKRLNWDTGVLSIVVGWSGSSFGYDRFINESEVAGCVMTVYASLDTRLDKTYKEIEDAGFALIRAGNNVHSLTQIGYEEGRYVVRFANTESLKYETETVDDYPKKIIANGPGGVVK